MSIDHDNEFQPPIEKVQAGYDTVERPSSKLAMTSLVFGILGVTALPLLGSIVAVATGHAALGRSANRGTAEGKALAKVGLGLGYFQIILSLIAAVIVAVILIFVVGWNRRGRPVSDPSPSLRLGRLPERREDGEPDGTKGLRLIEASEVAVNESDIIAYYNAGKPKSNPEFALLTTEKLLYLNDGRKTVFDLKDVVNIKDDKSFEQTYNVEHLPNGGTVNHFDFDVYHIEVRTKQGIRMRIDITPNQDGALFFDALRSALQGAGLALTPESGF